jgi:hypothetical protein
MFVSTVNTRFNWNSYTCVDALRYVKSLQIGCCHLVALVLCFLCSCLLVSGKTAELHRKQCVLMKLFFGCLFQQVSLLWGIHHKCVPLPRFSWLSSVFSGECRGRVTLISGFHRDVDEICDLLGYYAVSCGNCLPTFRDNVSVSSSRVKSPTLDTWIRDRYVVPKRR